MKKVLVTGCGGAPTINFVRSLRDADPNHQKYYIVGIDCNKYTIHRNECNKSYLCPPATNKYYIPFLLKIIRKEKIEFLHTQPEIEVYIIGKYRKILNQAGCRTYLPSQKTIGILRDKEKSYRIWKKAKVKVPKTIKINKLADLKKAFKEFGTEIWIRDTIGAAGKGSLSRPSYELAKAWIKYRKGWGQTIAAKHLTSRTTTWQSLWQNGKLVVGQGRERLYWEMANRTQSGVTGITGTGVIINDTKLAQLAIKCIKVVDNKPHGIFSVDLTYDLQGIPNPTEINIGKFFTTHHFITKAGCNMPEILIKLAFNEYTGKYNIINPCCKNLCWIRGMDVKPILIKMWRIKAKQIVYKKIINKIKKDL